MWQLASFNHMSDHHIFTLSWQCNYLITGLNLLEMVEPFKLRSRRKQATCLLTVYFLDQLKTGPHYNDLCTNIEDSDCFENFAK